MKRNKKIETEVQEVESVETNVVETETNPKKKVSFKKVGIGVAGVLTLIAGVGAVVLHKAKREKEIQNYMDSCGDDGSDFDDEGEDSELTDLVDSGTGEE